MSDFMTGLLLGSGNVFGEDKPAENDNGALLEQIRRLKAELAMDKAILGALKDALHDVSPSHPLICPMEYKSNPVRKKIGDEAWNKAMANPNL